MAAPRSLGEFGFGISGNAEGARWDNVANTLRVDGYGTLDARASWHFASAWTLQVTLVNAFDHNCQTTACYQQPSREIGLSLP